jgi:hypothetical protein
MKLVTLKFGQQYVTKKTNETWEEIMNHYRGKVVSIKEEYENIKG